MESYTDRPPYSVALDVVQRERRADSRYAALWDGNPPWYADDVIKARLNVLERQNRVDEYLDLAAATDQIDAYATMLVEESRIDEAIEYGQQNLHAPDNALTLARALREHDRPQAALEIAQYGLSLDGNGRADLAE